MRKNNTIEAFFALLRAGLWENDVQLAQYGSLDYGEILKISQEQSVVGLVAAGLEHVTDVKVPQAVVLQFVGETLQIEQRNKTMNAFIAEQASILQSKEIEYVLLKGQGIAQCYERPLWRSSGDVDLLLDEKNFCKAQQYLYTIASAYEPLLKEEKHQEFTVGSWIIELHGNQPTHFSHRTDELLAELQEDAFAKSNVRIWDNNGVSIPLLCPDSDVLFVFTHYLKHFFRGGIGLRQICDWCRLLYTYKDSIIFETLHERLIKTKLMTEWLAFLAFAVDWLGMPCDAAPFYEEQKNLKRKANRILDFILLTGNFGHNRERSYYQRYPYIIGKFISLYWRSMDNIRYFFIFPVDSLRVLAWLIRHGFKNLNRTRIEVS